MAKQFTREWEIWKLTNEAAAGREDEEKIEREKKMAGARKERDRVRAEMIREEATERALRGDVRLGGAASGNGGGGRGGVEGSPPWGGRNGRGGSGSPGRAPWDEPARSDVGDSAPWNRPIGGGESDGGVSPAWDGGISAGSTSVGGRAPWDEPAESSSAPWNDASLNLSGRSPSYEPPGSTGGQSYGGSSSRAPWDLPAGERSSSYELPGSGRSQSYKSGQQASSSSGAPWDAPASGRSPTYESPGSKGSQSYQSGQQASPSSKTPLGQPAESSVAPWDQPTISPSRAPWDDVTGGNDSSVFRSPSNSPERTPTSPPATTWDTPTGEPESDGILTASNDTVGEGRGRVAAHELHTFSALSAMSAPWGQDSDANELEHRDPNSEGEQVYLRRAAVAGSGTEALRDARNKGESKWEQGSGNNGSSGSNEGSGNEAGNAPCDNNNGDGNDTGDRDVSPPWSGGFGGSSPAAGYSDNNAPWENY